MVGRLWCAAGFGVLLGVAAALPVRAEGRVELLDSWWARDRDGRVRVERVDPGARVWWFVRLANRGDTRAAVEVRLERDGRRVARMRFRRGRQIAPGAEVESGKRLGRDETAVAGRRCYQVVLRPLGGGTVVSGGPRRLCLDVGRAGGDMADDGMPGDGMPGGDAPGTPRGAVLALRQVAFVGRPDCWRLEDGGQVCHARLVGRLANVGDAPAGPVVVELYAPIRGREVIPRRQGDTRRRVAGLAPGVETTVSFRLVFYDTGRQCAGIRIVSLPTGARIAEVPGIAPIDDQPGRRAACTTLPAVARAPTGPVELPPAPAWRVDIEVESIAVGFDGDNLSPGDWWVAMAAGPSGRSWQRGDAWPSVRHVDSDSQVRPGDLRVRLAEIPPERPLAVAIQVVDCDGGLTAGVDRYGVLAAPGIGRAPSCRLEEEFYEATGSSDVAVGTLTLTPAQWRRGGIYELRVREAEAARPLNAVFRLRVRAEPMVAAGASFREPTLEGLALDLCREWGRNCGQAAADAFCRLRGYRAASDYRVMRNRPPTITIGDRRICTAGFCDRISFVACRR